jgi:sulfur carrier protein ThiS
MTVQAKVVRVPGAVKDVELNSGATVSDALRAAGVDLGPGETVSMNGSTVEGSREISQGDRIIVAKGAKGA